MARYDQQREAEGEEQMNPVEMREHEEVRQLKYDLEALRVLFNQRGEVVTNREIELARSLDAQRDAELEALQALHDVDNMRAAAIAFQINFDRYNRRDRESRGRLSRQLHAIIGDDDGADDRAREHPAVAGRGTKACRCPARFTRMDYVAHLRARTPAQRLYTCARVPCDFSADRRSKIIAHFTSKIQHHQYASSKL